MDQPLSRSVSKTVGPHATSTASYPENRLSLRSIPATAILRDCRHKEV
ncbi:hypothetical protein [Azospirillum argentinense]